MFSYFWLTIHGFYIKSSGFLYKEKMKEMTWI